MLGPLGWIAYLCINANARLRQIWSRMCGSLLRTGAGSVNPPMASLFVLGSTAPQSHREDKPKDVASSHAAFCKRRHTIFHQQQQHAPQSHTARVTHIQHGPATHVSPDTMAAHKAFNEHVPHGRNGTPESPSRDPKHGQNDVTRIKVQARPEACTTQSHTHSLNVCTQDLQTSCTPRSKWNPYACPKHAKKHPARSEKNPARDTIVATGGNRIKVTKHSLLRVLMPRVSKCDLAAPMRLAWAPASPPQLWRQILKESALRELLRFPEKSCLTKPYHVGFFWRVILKQTSGLLLSYRRWSTSCSTSRRNCTHHPAASAAAASDARNAQSRARREWGCTPHGFLTNVFVTCGFPVQPSVCLIYISSSPVNRELRASLVHKPVHLPKKTCSNYFCRQQVLTHHLFFSSFQPSCSIWNLLRTYLGNVFRLKIERMRDGVV